MKFIKLAIISVAILASSAWANNLEFVEQTCNNSAESYVAVQRALNSSRVSLVDALNNVNDLNESRYVKSKVKERIIHVYKIKHLPEEQVRRYGFVDCISRFR